MSSAKKKKLIAIGDSFTDPNFWSPVEPDHVKDYPSWPEVLNNLLHNEYDVINTSHSGVGNDYIYAESMHHIADNIDNIGLVVLALSEPGRYTVGSARTKLHGDLVQNIMNNSKPEYADKLETDKYTKYLDMVFNDSNTIEDISHFIDKILSSILLFQTFCEKNKIPYIIVSMLDQTDLFMRDLWSRNTNRLTVWNVKSFSKELIKNPMFDLIDDEKVIGWPFVEILGGYPFIEKLEIGKETVSERDHHPNKLGHEKIAKDIYNLYIKLYK